MWTFRDGVVQVTSEKSLRDIRRLQGSKPADVAQRLLRDPRGCPVCDTIWIMPRIKDQAICIRHLDWSETSQVVVLLTQTQGLVRGLAKGSRRMSPSSVQRFSGGLELLTLGQIVMTLKPSAELATLTEWDLQQDYHALRHDLHAQRVALYGADLCHALLAPHDPHPRAFDAFRRLLDELTHDPNPGVGDRAKALLRFQWELLDDCGYRPELWADVVTGEELPTAAAYTFDPKAGGLTRQQGVGDWRVRKSTVQLLRLVASNEMPEAGADVVDRANRLLCVYIRSILDRELPTMRFITTS